MQSVSSDFVQKVSEIDLKVAAQKKIPTCAKESALIPDVRNLQKTSNQNTRYSSRTQNHFYINRKPLRGGNLL